MQSLNVNRTLLAERQITIVGPGTCTMKKTLFLLLLLASCSGKDRDVDILDKARFMDVYVALATTDPTDSTRSQSDVAAAVLQKQGVTEEKFRATVEYYNRHPESWKEILDSVMHRMEAASAGKEQPGKKPPG
jgi:hypothetical protein